MNLQELGEERLLQQILPQLPQTRAVVAGAGDDCAVAKFGGGENSLLLLKTDCVVEGVHFESGARAAAVGWKAMARPLSDFAAMAGVPQFALVTLLAPPTTSGAWVMGVYRGLTKAARAFDVAIVGGETSGTDGPVVISVSLTGVVEAKRWISRRGGKAGDALFVTGRLGGSIRGKHLRFMPRIREAGWLAQNFAVHAMMDLSDGLGADLPRLAAASRVGFELDEAAIPRTRGCSLAQAISDGEDYELLFALAPEEAVSLQKKWSRRFPRLALTRIGRFVREMKGQGEKLKGYVHFQ
ncbi:MAG: thiamine-phosphate kinase [Chthoniobacterales bacterium]